LTLAYFARLIEAMYFADRPAAGTATPATDAQRQYFIDPDALSFL